MSYQKILIGEISSEIDNLIELKITIDPGAVTTKICANHQQELSGDAPFSTHNNYTNVRREVRSVMSKKLNPDQTIENQQLIIDGFKYVQRYYSVERNGEQVGVPVDQLTEDEINQKTKELRKMGRACLRHASELEQYYISKLVNV